VYILLYVIVGIRQILGLLNHVRHGGAFDFNLFEESLRRGPDREGFNPKEDFQAFLAYGLFTLVIIRALAFCFWLRLTGRAAAVAGPAGDARLRWPPSQRHQCGARGNESGSQSNLPGKLLAKKEHGEKHDEHDTELIDWRDPGSRP
jgi:hypothetical protein